MEEDKDKLDFSIFKAEYFSDAKEGFQEINTALLILEKDYRRLESLDEIFRVIHTFKSSSVMLGFTNIAELAHDSEDFLDMMRKREITVNAESLDCLFDIIDTLQKMVNAKSQGKDRINFTHVAAVGVDSMFDITENIVKPFDPIARKFKGFSGGTIMADGRVALLLDISPLVKFKTAKKLEKVNI